MLKDCYKQVLKNWFGKEENERRFIDYMVEVLEKRWKDKNIFVIEAPTGYGKSIISATISLFSLKSDDSLKCIVAFPLRTLLEDQYCKFVGEYKVGKEISCKGKKSILGDMDQNLRLRIVGKRYMHNPDSRYLVKPITLTTIDTLSLTLFGIPPECLDKVVKAWDGTAGGSLGHYLFSWCSVVFSNVVLDEVHLLADSTKSLSFLIALMKIAVDFDQKLILMSATLPKSLKEKIRSYAEKFNFADSLCMISSTPKGSILETYFDKEKCSGWDSKFAKERLKKRYNVVLEKLEEENKFDKILSWIRESEFRKVIVIFNTVEEAVRFYERNVDELRKIFGENVILLHSRFSELDRREKIEKLKELKKSDHYLIISTQVIEAGVDVSSNLFITDIAPANSLIQRLGRFLRYDEVEGKVIVWYETDAEGNLRVTSKVDRVYKVYDYDLTKRTLEWLKENSENGIVKLNVHLPYVDNPDKKGYADLLNIYTESDFEVRDDVIRDFESIFLHLENASLIAVEKFMEMEGSFVRDELQTPIVPKSVVDDLVDENRIINEKPVELVEKFVVPIAFRKFRMRNFKIFGVVREVEVEDNGKRVLKLKFINTSEDSWLSFVLTRNTPKDVLKYMIKRDVLAFVAEAEYGEEGLRFYER